VPRRIQHLAAGVGDVQLKHVRNAICERIIGTLRREVPGQLLTASEHHLRQVLTEYILHNRPDGATRIRRSLP
jgi:hypothetical protein